MAKILIIDDDQAVVSNLVQALKDKHEVLTVASGQEGLAQASSQQPDLIILDVMLPDLNGIEVLKALSRDIKTNNINVLILTNLSDHDTVSKIIAAGGREYLVKADLSINEITEKIESLL
ncbi:MAG: response regulator [Patescibacteria group bacterium]|nr:response regulator [Patescibacteria group bacterium]